MALTSSSPGPEYHPHRSNLFHGARLVVPSSPSASYVDGEISPSFDASFASSMSITSDPVTGPSPLSQSSRHGFALASSPHLMDISPAPAPPSSFHLLRPPLVHAQTATVDQFGFTPLGFKSRPFLDRACSTNDYPFLKNLFQPTTTTAPSTSSSTSSAPHLQRSSSLEELGSPGPATQGALAHSRFPTISKAPFEQDDFDFTAKVEGLRVRSRSGSEETHSSKDGGLRVPTLLKPAAQKSGHSSKPSRHTAPAGGLFPPPAVPAKRLSEPALPTFQTTESSPVRMDVDGTSPTSARGSSRLQHPRSTSDMCAPTALSRTGSASEVKLFGSFDSPEDQRLGAIFAENLSPTEDLSQSPVRNSRKRFLDLSPSPACGSSPTPPSGSGSASASLSLALGLGLTSTAPLSIASRKSSSTSLSSHIARRRPSSNGLGAIKRPGLTSVSSMGLPPSAHDAKLEAGTFKRHAQALNGKPAATSKARRAYSVADASGQGLFTARDPNIPDSYRQSTAGDGYFHTLGSKRGAGVSFDVGTMNGHARRAKEVDSPLTGFRSQETRGKALPCFGVKEDGLMRITSDTLKGLQEGDFASGIKRYLIIDCRFSYEYEGGHIAEAVNLPTTADVEAALLAIECPPSPSTSEDGPCDGKTILVFHCEFSAKRAPTSAKHLRSKDRILNIAEYPKVHYPEVYVLQGGYADFFKSFPDRCTGGYLPMDDPEHNAKRSVDLHAFRQQTRQFNRASSFTFGQAQSASAMLKAASTTRPLVNRANSLAPSGFVFPITERKGDAKMAITEEDHESGDSSFGTNSGSSPGGDGSPCPTSKVGRHSLKIGKELGGRRILERAQTAVSMFQRS